MTKITATRRRLNDDKSVRPPEVTREEVRALFKSTIVRGHMPNDGFCAEIAKFMNIMICIEQDTKLLSDDLALVKSHKKNRDALTLLKVAIRKYGGGPSERSMMSVNESAAMNELEAAIEKARSYLAPPSRGLRLKIAPLYLNLLIISQVALRVAGNRGESMGRNTHAARFCEAAFARVGVRDGTKYIGREDVANTWEWWNTRSNGQIARDVSALVTGWSLPDITMT